MNSDVLNVNREAWQAMGDRIVALEAENEKLKASLKWISELSPVGLNIGAAIQEAERALSTEEGGG